MVKLLSLLYTVLYLAKGVSVRKKAENNYFEQNQKNKKKGLPNRSLCCIVGCDVVALETDLPFVGTMLRVAMFGAN